MMSGYPEFEGITFTEDNIDDFEVDDLARWFSIHTRLVNYERGPEYGEWLAWQDDGPSVRAAFRDEAIVELALLIAKAG